MIADNADQWTRGSIILAVLFLIIFFAMKAIDRRQK